MTKLKADQEDLKAFSIAKLVNYEGCPDASRFFLKKFGDKVDDLFKYEDYVNEVIIKHNKPHWIVNFFLNLIHDEYRLKFFNLIFKDVLFNVDDYELKKELKKAMKAIEKVEPYNLNDLLVKFQTELEPLSKDILSNENKYNNIMFKIKVIESLIFLLEDEENRYTRSLTSALMNLADAQTYFDPYNSADNVNQKKIALRLVDYSGVFK